MERISWDDYFSIMVLWARIRSPDNSTQHGCVITDQDHKIIGIGYNGCVKNCQDDLIPQERPMKYDFMIHSELNAILNSNSNLKNCIAYISGPPCIKCLGLLIQVGISKIIYGPIVSTSPQSICKSTPEEDIKKFHLINNNIEIKKWQPNNKNLILKKLQELINGV